MARCIAPVFGYVRAGLPPVGQRLARTVMSFIMLRTSGVVSWPMRAFTLIGLMITWAISVTPSRLHRSILRHALVIHLRELINQRGRCGDLLRCSLLACLHDRRFLRRSHILRPGSLAVGLG